MQKLSPLPGFDPRNVQLVASRYTNWAIPTTSRLFRIHSHSPNEIPTCLLSYGIHYERAFAHLYYRLSEVTRPATFIRMALKEQCKCVTSTPTRMSSTAVGFWKHRNWISDSIKARIYLPLQLTRASKDIFSIP
jgi:hypothetical protein